MLDQAVLDMLCTTVQETGSVVVAEATVAEVRQISDALGISDAGVRLGPSPNGYGLLIEVG